MTARRSMLGWVKKRARRLMAAFGVPRAKAVRYACDDWIGFQGLPKYPFAPGVIEGGARHKGSTMQRLIDWVRWSS